jgi:hypothetical protein
MTLAETLRQNLANGAPQNERHDLALAHAGWSLHATLDRRDELGCLLWELTLRRTAAAPEGETLRTWAERLAGKSMGLLEPLKVVEVDDLRNEALLRSNAPAQRGGRLYYYELLLHGTRQAVLHRYQGAATSGKRTQVAFALTHEALVKLVEDLSAAP